MFRELHLQSRFRCTGGWKTIKEYLIYKSRIDGMNGKRGKIKMQENGINENNSRISAAMRKAAGFKLFSALAAVLLLALFISVTAGEADSASAAAAKKVTLNSDDVKADVTFGNAGKAKSSRNVPITADITNKGKDFSGIIRIRFRTSYSDSRDAMVEQAFDIAAGQSKKVQLLLLPYNDEGGNLIVELCDKDGDVLNKKEMSTIFDDDLTSIFVGVLSDDASGLGYMKSIFTAYESKQDEDVFDDEIDEDYQDVSSAVNQDASDEDNQDASEDNVYYEDINNQAGAFFELKADDIGDSAEWLDMYDILIVDNFDTSTLRPEQKKAIVSWVRQGGTLVLAAGGNPDKVLGGFADEEEFKVDVNGSAKTVKTSFGLSKEDIIQYSGNQGKTDPVEALISNLALSGSDKAVLKDGNGELMQRKEIGSGALMVSEFSMSLQKDVWNTYGGALLYIIRLNMGKRDMANVMIGTNTDGYYYYGVDGIDSLDAALRRNESKSLPNLALYTFLLLAYAAIAGPVLYFVLLKMDKRTLLWGAVPASAVVFSLLIYLIGSSTRIQRPYVKYLSEISLDNGDMDNLPMRTRFTITSPSNRSFDIDLNKDMMVNPNFTEDYISSFGSDTGYRYGIHREGDKQTIDMAEVSAFSDSRFLAKRDVSINGDVDINIEGKDKASGTVTNNTSHALEDCFIYYNNNLYYWKEIPAGESVSIVNSDFYYNVNIPSEQNEYGEDYFDIDYVMQDASAGVFEAFGYNQTYDTVNDNRVARKMAMLANKIYYGDFSSIGTSNFFYGFLKEGDDGDLFSDAFDGIDNYGVTAVTKACG